MKEVDITKQNWKQWRRKFDLRGENEREVCNDKIVRGEKK